MICQDELGQLEAHHEDFVRRGARVVAVSSDDASETARTQAAFPHLLVVADPGKSTISAAGVFLPRSIPSGLDTAAPTTVLIDPTGVVRWIHRPRTYLERLPVNEVLAAVDQYLPADRRRQ